MQGSSKICTGNIFLQFLQETCKISSNKQFAGFLVKISDFKVPYNIPGMSTQLDSCVATAIMQAIATDSHYLVYIRDHEKLATKI